MQLLVEEKVSHHQQLNRGAARDYPRSRIVVKYFLGRWMQGSLAVQKQQPLTTHKRLVSITQSMAQQLIQLLRSENIDFVVAPNEADAQLAYLSNLKPKKGGIHAVIMETAVFKMDRYGNGEQIVLDKGFASEIPEPSFWQFDLHLFTGMCVLASCHFLPSVPGIGIAKAHALVSKYPNLD
ncbi:hypothetical protein ACFE04_014011 [Oxalis oulophora]